MLFCRIRRFSCMFPEIFASRFDTFIGLVKTVFSLSWHLPVGVGRGLESGPWEDGKRASILLSTSYSVTETGSQPCSLGISFDVLPATFIGHLPDITCWMFYMSVWLCRLTQDVHNTHSFSRYYGGAAVCQALC